MKLLEYKGKELLAGCGVRSAPGIVTDNKSYINLSFHKERYKEFFYDHKKVIIKAQIAAIHRKQNGYIIEADNYKESLKLIEGLYDSEYKEQPITTLLTASASMKAWPKAKPYCSTHRTTWSWAPVTSTLERSSWIWSSVLRPSKSVSPE